MQNLYLPVLTIYINPSTPLAKEIEQNLHNAKIRNTLTNLIRYAGQQPDIIIVLSYRHVDRAYFFISPHCVHREVLEYAKIHLSPASEHAMIFLINSNVGLVYEIVRKWGYLLDLVK